MNLIVGTDAARGLLFVKGSVPGSKGGWLQVTDAIKIPRNENVPYPAGLIVKGEKIEETPLGLVDEAAVEAIPALPGDDEVKAIAAEQEAGAVEAENNENTDAGGDKAADDGKEG